MDRNLAVSASIGRLICLFGLTAILLLVAVAATAQNCRQFKLTDSALERWYDPHPSPGEFKLPMPLGMSLVFVAIPLGTEGLYGDETSTYLMGSSTPRLPPPPPAARVGSSISTRGEARLLFGKYEVTKAQYVAVMGKGILAQGARILLERTRDPRARHILAPFISGPCRGVLSQEVYEYLSEPISFLSYRDYIDFLDEYNLFCTSRIDCRNGLSGLGPNRKVPGFVRLPAEHEWEFVARGGARYVAGEISKQEFQSDLPQVQPGTTILRHAHVGSDPPRPLAVGSKEPLFEIYDLFGNVQELMLNPFTAENGYGAVGGYVARGGHFRLSQEELRVSRRVELQAFRLDERQNSFVLQFFPLTGIRLVVGYPVIGAADRLGDDSLQQDFVENYAPPGEAGDIAGNNIANARDLGVVDDDKVSVREELSPDDSVDYFKIELVEYSRLSVSLLSDASIKFEVIDRLQKIVRTGWSGGAIHTSRALLPGDYWIKLVSSRKLAAERKYRIEVSRSPVADTGIARPNSTSLAGAINLTTTPRRFSGYVGRGDTVDTFAIRNRSTTGGLEFQVEDISAPVTLTYLDKNLRIVQRMEIDPEDSNRRMVLNSSYGNAGFIQVSTQPGFATTFNLKVSTKAPYDSIFRKRPGASYSGPFARANVSYGGNLDKSLPKLYLPVRLHEARILRLEMTGLSADADLKVLDADGNVVPSSHIRKGTDPEFFSEQVSAGKYFAEVGLKSTRDVSGFKLLLSSSRVQTQSVPDELAFRRLFAIDLGSLEDERFESGNVIKDTVYYRFSIPDDEQLLDIDLSGFAVAADLDIFLEDWTGNVLSQSINMRGVPERIRYQAVSGLYFLRITKTGRAWSSRYRISVSKVPEMVEPNLSFMGVKIRTIGDYDIFLDAPEEMCYMVTQAKEVIPEIGWRTTRPFFYIRVSKDKDGIGISMDHNLDFANSLSEYWGPGVSAQVKGPLNRISKVAAVWESDFLKPMTSDRMFIDGDALNRFAEGDSLEIYGQTSDGDRAKVVYSLMGYKSSGRIINVICDADADWIWDN